MAKLGKRNELAAGLFIVASVATGVVVLILLANWRSLLERQHEVAVVFYDQSVKGLDAGSVVRFNGVPIGEVSELLLDYANPRDIRAVISVPEDLKLYANASLYIGTATLGGGAWIEIEDVGDPQGCRLENDGRITWTRLAKSAAAPAATGQDQPAETLPPAGETVPLADLDHPIVGSERPNAMIADLAKQAGFGAEQQTQVQQTVANIRDATCNLSEVTAMVRNSMAPKVDLALDNVVDITRTGKSLVTTINQQAGPILAKIDRTVTVFEKLSAEKGPVLAEALDHIRGTTATWDAGSKQQLANIQKAMDQLNDALATARAALGNVRDMTAVGRDLLAVNRDSVNDTIANFKEGSDHFAAALAEVRRNPWRLLYRPKADELDSANVMVAARAFAEGAGRLRDTTTRLAVLVRERGGDPPADDPQLREIVADLVDSYQKFQKAEMQIYELLGTKQQP